MIYDYAFYCTSNHQIHPYISLINPKVTEVDENGGYLLNRIKRVEQLKKDNSNSYWINQYGNPYNAEAYRETLGQEICKDLDKIDYVFMGVSSGGTITGVSQKIKDVFPKAKIVAVDIVGSIIFGGSPQKRLIPGIGSSMVPEILKQAKIDEVVMVDEFSTVETCQDLLRENCLFVGGSSGSVYLAIKKYFMGKNFDAKLNVVAIFADRGDRYINTIYNEAWRMDFLKNINGK